MKMGKMKTQLKKKNNLKLNGFVNQSNDNKLIDCNYERELELYQYAAVVPDKYPSVTDNIPMVKHVGFWYFLIGLFCSSRPFPIRTYWAKNTLQLLLRVHGWVA